MGTNRGRIVQANQVVLDQADFYQGDGFTRVVGLGPGNIVSRVFYNNSIQAWPLVSGNAVNDSQITSGRIYFHEIPGQPGFYSVRFRPDALGYWRTLLTYPAGLQEMAQDFDVLQSAPTMESGLQASFVKPQGSGSCC